MSKKFLYKKLLKLKRNIHHSKKILNFKKKKWKNFIYIYKKSLTGRHKIFGVYDHNKHVLKHHTTNFKNQHSYNLMLKNRLSFFYGRLKTKYVKKIINTTRKKNFNNLTYNYNILKKLESRLDSILYRAHFTKNIKEAKQLIKAKQVFVNNQLINKSSFLLKHGDFIEISKNSHYKIIKFLETTEFWPIPPKHLQINYKTLQIIFIETFKHSNFLSQYPFWIDLNSWVRNYKHK